MKTGNSGYRLCFDDYLTEELSSFGLSLGYRVLAEAGVRIGPYIFPTNSMKKKPWWKRMFGSLYSVHIIAEIKNGTTLVVHDPSYGDACMAIATIIGKYITLDSRLPVLCKGDKPFVIRYY